MLWFRQRIFLRRAARGRKLDQRASRWPFSWILRYQRNGSDLEHWYGSWGLSQLGCFDQFYWIITINVGFFLVALTWVLTLVLPMLVNGSSQIDDLHCRNCQTQRWFWLMLTTCYATLLFHSNVLQIRLYTLIPVYLLALIRARHWQIPCCFNYESKVAAFISTLEQNPQRRVSVVFLFFFFRTVADIALAHFSLSTFLIHLCSAGRQGSWCGADRWGAALFWSEADSLFISSCQTEYCLICSFTLSSISGQMTSAHENRLL